MQPDNICWEMKFEYKKDKGETSVLQIRCWYLLNAYKGYNQKRTFPTAFVCCVH